MSPEDPHALLASLRWKEDMCITNHFKERVWLKPCFDSGGKRIGITECCFADEACERHRQLALTEASSPGGAA